jgi:hypothetical protein
MFSIGTLYNFACSYAVIPIKNISYLHVNSIPSLQDHNKKNFFFNSSSGFDFSLPSSDGEGD